MDEVRKLKEKLFENVKNYTPEDIEMIKKACKIAEKCHNNQKRKSGEPYIIHPLWVAIILSELQVDVETICAGLLHDTVEDTDMTLCELEQLFNKDVSIIVDGVTKITGLNTGEEARYLNIRKIINSMLVDIRSILVKLADRLHNMRTMEYMPEKKQINKSKETMDLYVPLAYRVGVYRIMHELQDRSFYYINREEFEKYEKIYNNARLENMEILSSMSENINKILIENNIDNYIKTRTKNIYGIYDRINKLKQRNFSAEIKDIHDLHSLKIMIKDIDDCYKSLRYIHGAYHPINSKFKDYICSPKPNMYQSLHSTLIAPNGLLVQAQIRTPEQDEVASFGIAKYWNYNGKNSRNKMQNQIQENFKSTYKIYSMLKNIDDIFGLMDNKGFVETVNRELLEPSICVLSKTGDNIELPVGATVIDYAYFISDELGDKFDYAIVNDKKVSGDYVLDNDDRVIIFTDELSKGPDEKYLSSVKTEYAKNRILSLKK